MIGCEFREECLIADIELWIRIEIDFGLLFLLDYFHLENVCNVCTVGAEQYTESSRLCPGSRQYLSKLVFRCEMIEYL